MLFCKVITLKLLNSAPPVTDVFLKQLPYFTWQMGSLNPLLLNLRLHVYVYCVALTHLSTCTNKTIHSIAHTHTLNTHPLTFLPPSICIGLDWGQEHTSLAAAEHMGQLKSTCQVQAHTESTASSQTKEQEEQQAQRERREKAKSVQLCDSVLCV